MQFAALPSQIAVARRGVTAYARRADIVDVGAVELAVSEAITNAVVHAYRDRPNPGVVSVVADHPPDDGLVVTVEDDGCGLIPRHDSPGVGLGLALLARLTEALEFETRPGGGTRVAMRFARV